MTNTLAFVPGTVLLAFSTRSNIFDKCNFRKLIRGNLQVSLGLLTVGLLTRTPWQAVAADTDPDGV